MATGKTGSVVSRKRRKPSDRTKKGRPKKKRGPPPFEPTGDQRKQVEAMVGYGLTYREIASLIENPKTGRGIDVNTLMARFPKELEQGASKVKVRVVNSLVKKACSDSHPGAVAAAIWITKSRFGWKGVDQFSHQIDVNTGVLLAPAILTPAQWMEQQQAAKD